MPRLKHRSTGVVVRVAESHPATRSSAWSPHEAKPAPKPAPRRRRTKKQEDDDGNMADSGGPDTVH